MLDIIHNQILFFLALVFVMFLPGWCLLLAIFGKNKIISDLERFIFAFGLSIISVDFILFSYTGLHILITKLSVILGIIIFSGICYGIYRYRRHSAEIQNETTEKLFSFSKNQFILIILLLFLTIFIKTAYLSTALAPTPTDLGHHTYWSKLIADTHQLTNYEGLPDFIIGEHTMFASIYLLTGLNFLTGWVVVTLHFINLLGILTVFVLTLRIFREKVPAILTLLFLGVLFAVTAPQSKYVSGGVMGNIFGDFLMPLALYFYYRGFQFLENEDWELNTSSRPFLGLAVFTTVGLFYTHHLTAFIFLFVFALLVPIFLIANYKNIKSIFSKVWQAIFSPQVLIIFVIGLIFFFFIFTPTYVATKAVGTAVGAATKSTRVGLTMANLKQTVGEPRIALGFLGFLILLFTFRRKNFGFSLLAAWAGMLFIMSVFPTVLFVNLPSARIGNYLSYPLAILSAYAFYAIFRPESCRLFWGRKLCETSQGLVIEKLLKGTFLIILVFVLTDGLSDSALSFKKQDSLTQASQTFHAAQYLAQNSNTSDIILKDHNYITADSWIKLFFMRGYTYPASRGYFKRYEDTGNRNQDVCTLVMISSPDTDQAKTCFADTKTDFLMINPKYDASQFQKLADFNQIYMSPEVAIYYKKN